MSKIDYANSVHPRMPEKLEGFVWKIFELARESKHKTGQVPATVYFAKKDFEDIDGIAVQSLGASNMLEALKLVRAEVTQNLADHVVLICQIAIEKTAEGTAARRAESAGRNRYLPTARQHLCIRVEGVDGTWIATPRVVQKIRRESFDDPVFKFLNYSDEKLDSLSTSGSIQ